MGVLYLVMITTQKQHMCLNRHFFTFSSTIIFQVRIVLSASLTAFSDAPSGVFLFCLMGFYHGSAVVLLA